MRRVSRKRDQSEIGILCYKNPDRNQRNQKGHQDLINLTGKKAKVMTTAQYQAFQGITVEARLR